MKRVFFILGVILLLLPIVFAFDCSLTTDENYCNEILELDLNESELDLVLSSLLYTNSNYPNYEFIEEYNENLEIEDAPDNTTIYDSTYIQDAWFSFLAVYPSVYENDILYTTENISLLSAYDYEVELPSGTASGDCRTYYSLPSNSANVYYYLNGDLLGVEDNYIISEDGTITSELEIYVTIAITHYQIEVEEYQYYIGGRIYYRDTCEYSHTSYEYDSLTINEDKEITFYKKQPYLDITITNQYKDTTKGNYTVSNYSYLIISFNNSHLEKQAYYYDLVFEKKPYYIAYLRANPTNQISISNLFFSEETFYVSDTTNCSLYAYNYFYNYSSECDLTLQQEEIGDLGIEENDLDLSLLLWFLTFCLIIYIIYRLLQSQAKKIVIPLFFIILCLTPFVLADDDEECGLTNLASCLPEAIYEYILVLINAPILPLLVAVESLLTVEVRIDIFFHLWSIIRYMISFFYIFLFIYVGYVFLTSSSNPIKRAHAKDMLRDIFLMIVLIQGSYYIYSLLLDLNVILNNVVFTFIDPTFFLITADNIVNIGLEFIYATAYLSTLFITVLMLVLRFMVVSFGVVLFPIAIFCYFIPPLKGYGKFMINALMLFIFITFIDLLIILGSSMLVDIPLFENFEILVMCTCFGLVNYSVWLAIKFAMKMSVTTSLKDDLNQAVKYIALIA
jgi:hypothetical protein